MKSFQNRYVVGRESGEFGNIGARRQLVPIALEVCREVASISEVVHDVFVVRRVLEAKRMPYFVDARKVDNGVAKKTISRGTRCERFSHEPAGRRPE